MASYDWFLCSLNRMHSTAPRAIGKTIYVIDKRKYTITKGRVIDVKGDIVKYACYVKKRNQKRTESIYKEVKYSQKHILWFYNESTAHEEIARLKEANGIED